MVMASKMLDEAKTGVFDAVAAGVRRFASVMLSKGMEIERVKASAKRISSKLENVRRKIV